MWHLHCRLVIIALDATIQLLEELAKLRHRDSLSLAQQRHEEGLELYCTCTTSSEESLELYCLDCGYSFLTEHRHPRPRARTVRGGFVSFCSFAAEDTIHR